MIKCILSSLILFLCALWSFILGFKFIRLLSRAALELSRLYPYDNGDD